MIYLIGDEPIVPSENYSMSTIESCLKYFEKHNEIQIDTETKGRDPHTKKILSLQIGDTENQFVIDCRTNNILAFKQLLESKIVLAHNAKFDYKFLKKAGVLLDKIYDTMLAECVTYAGYESFGYSLKDLCRRYLNIELDKNTRGEFYKIEDQPFTDTQIQYAARDVAYLQEIKERQRILIEKYDLQYCVDLENEVLKALGDIEYNGVYLNKEMWLSNAQEYEKKLKECIKELDGIVENDKILSTKYVPQYIQGNLFGFEQRELNINYASPLQIMKICKDLGYEVLSTEDRELKRLAKKHQFFRKLQDFREMAKVVSTYGDSFLKCINKSTGRVHTDFWQIVSTGRVSSGNKETNSPNMQNVPAQDNFRNCFEVRPGFSWVSHDYSGQEMRIMVDKSNDEILMNAINEGKDPHCFIGSMMFKKEILKTDKEIRPKVKTINFMLPYGGGPPKLSDLMDISLSESEELFSLHKNTFPTLNKWLKQQSLKAKSNMYSVTFAPCNRRRWFPDMKLARSLREDMNNDKFIEETERKAAWKRILTIEGSTEREGCNHPIQGCGADITKEALVAVRNEILLMNKHHNEEVSYLILTVHDEIDTEVREDLAQEFAKNVNDIMINCGNKYVQQVKMEVDCTITKYWKK